jgi:Rrf2 family protein
MRVSQRLDYAVRAAVLLAGQPKGQYVAAGELALRLGLPRRFVEQQITELARAGIVTCRRGSTGGCRLARPAEDISALDIVLALNGEVLDVPRQPGSAVAEFWAGTAVALEERLAGTTLAGLLERQISLDAEHAPVYYI